MANPANLSYLQKKLRSMLHRPLYRYLIVGSSVYLFELIIIFGSLAMGASNLVAVSLSFWLGLILSFWLQKIVAFNDKRLSHKVLVPQIVAVCVLVGWNYGFTLFVTSFLAPAVPAAISRTVALLVTTTWNFYLYKTRIFKTHADEEVVIY